MSNLFKRLKTLIKIAHADHETLFTQSTMTETERQHEFKSGRVHDLDQLYVYTIQQDPYRLLLTPLVFNLIKAKDERFIKLDVATLALTNDQDLFDDEDQLNKTIVDIISDIKAGYMPATLDKNDAIRTVNKLNAEREYLASKYKIKGMDNHVIEHRSLKNALEAITDQPIPDYGVVE